MKRCPTCNRTYEDGTMRFCLEDGMVLQPDTRTDDDNLYATLELPASEGNGLPPTVASARQSTLSYQPGLPARQVALPDVGLKPRYPASRLFWTFGIVFVLAVSSIIVALILTQGRERNMSAAAQTPTPTISPSVETAIAKSQPTQGNISVAPPKPSPLATVQAPPASSQVSPSEPERTSPSPQEHVGAVRVQDFSEGSRVSITSDLPLNNYESYLRGNRFYVKIPMMQVAGAQGIRGRGFDEVRVQTSGESTVLSFRLNPDTTARVDQKGNRLDVVFRTRVE